MCERAWRTGRAIRRGATRLAAAAALLAGATGAAATGAGAQTGSGAGDSLAARARLIHERVITIDTHVDIDPRNFGTAAPNYATGVERTQVDVPKMERGGLDAAFLIVYVGQAPDFTPAGYAKARATAMAKFEAIHRLTRELAPDRAALALTPDDVRRAHAARKRAILIGVENAYPLGEDLGEIARFHALGARYLSLAHNGHSQFSDSNTGEREGWKHGGLSALGERAIAELNRVGIMIDVSHPSKASMMRTLALTKAPVIASHSGARALANHSRNLDDEQLLALKRNGGVAQMVAFASYVKEGARRPDRPDTSSAPRPVATVRDFVDHIDHAVRLIGIDHVGISSDFDGGGGVEGWMDATETPSVTVELVRRGYTEEQIRKLWGENLLRVLGEVQRVAAEMAREPAAR